jgi:hypothetical protein
MCGARAEVLDVDRAIAPVGLHCKTGGEIRLKAFWAIWQAMGAVCKPPTRFGRLWEPSECFRDASAGFGNLLEASGPTWQALGAKKFEPRKP